MNMQKLMQEAKKMQAQLLKDQEELDKTMYEGKSQNVTITINGKYEVVSVKFDDSFEIEKDDMDMLEDMIMLAMNDAVKKVNSDKEKKMGKYGQGLTGLM